MLQERMIDEVMGEQKELEIKRQKSCKEIKMLVLRHPVNHEWVLCRSTTLRNIYLNANRWIGG
jgi:hypothetical protein